MSNIITSGFPRTLYRLVLVILLVGMSQFEAEAVSSRFKQIGHMDVSPEKIMPLKKSSVRKAAARSDSGIAGTFMCKDVNADSYTESTGIYVAEDYAWIWNTPDNITYEEEQTVLNYSTANTYFYFRSYNDSPVFEAIKIHLDSTKTNNASVRAGFADFEAGELYYSDTQIVADYANNIIYWKPDTIYDKDNIFFYIESGELNVIGLEMYSEGNTPEDFLAGSNISTVESPVFHPASCTFTTPISVEITADEGCNVYYRTDGYAPTIDEQYKYNGPIVISTTTTFKAIAADENGNTSRIVTATYTNNRHGIGEGYNPESPGNPGSTEDEIQKTYKLTVVTNPSGAGSAYANSYELKAGAQTSVYTYNNTGFNFLNWTIEGEEVSKSTSFYYVMPEYDVTIVANYSYAPASPGNPSPEEQKVKHPVTIRAIPSGAASLSPSGVFDMEENASRQIYAYPNNGWHLTGWTINGERLQSTSSPISITMGEKALDIVAYFDYNPSSPSNPGANYYNPTTGQVIVDDFTPGDLYSALSNLVGYDNFSNISDLIVKGELTSNDFGNLDYFSNVGTLDLSRTGGVTSIPSYAFQSMDVSNILLPSTITNIGSYAFSYCENLASLTIYAQVPPTCNSSTFNYFTNKSNCTVYVPASAIELYSNDSYWKGFTILPITNDAHVLQVNLPADASDGRYKNNSLEIANINSGVRQKYVISDRLLYTFNGLQKDEQYNIYLFSQTGLEIGRIENVVIPDQDIAVTFDNLKSLHSVFASVLTSDGTDVTSQVSVEWFKPLADGTTTYLRKGTSLGEIPEGQQLICRVSLDHKLGVIYANPEDVVFTIGSDNNTCTINLTAFRSIELSGSVVDGDGTALAGASVSVNQTLNNKYSKTYTTKTDRKGQWNLSVLDAPETRITFAASECVNVNDTIGAFAADATSFDLGKKTLKSIVGARVTYGFTYQAAGSEEVQDYYSDYQNVVVSVYNVTQNRAHNEISLQYPILAVLDENINVGDELKLTATSKTGVFNPIVETVTIGDDQRAEATFDIIGKGGISASFEMTDNPAVTAMLYGSNGELLKKITYSEAKALFTELEDGDYTLVSMGQSDLMNSILRLSNFSEIGLVEGKDYVKNSVKVESGKLTEVTISEVPAFDESLFYYTNSNTSFTSNKSSITTGNYLTLRSVIDFKGVYKANISNVALVVDLPEACDFVEQSVIQGPNLLPYTLDSNRLTIQLGNNYRTQTRFCVIPTTGGSFNATASIVFEYNGKIITQPIGSATSTIKDLEMQVLKKISKPEFNVKGYGTAASVVQVFDNKGNMLGASKVDKNGFWSAECRLNAPTNLSYHEIYAQITTPDDVVLTTKSECIVFDQNSIYPINVIGISDDVTEGQIVFDFVDTPKGPYYYTIVASDGGQITFIINLSNNNPEIVKGVTLYNHRVDGNVDILPAKYDNVKDRWYATIEDLNMDNVPVNVSLDIDFCSQPLCEFADHSELIENINDGFQLITKQFAEMDAYQSKGTSITENEIEEFDATYGININPSDQDFLPEEFDNWSADEQDEYVNNYFNENQAILDEEQTYFDGIIDAFSPENNSSEPVIFTDGSSIETKTCTDITIEELISNGYEKVEMIDGTDVYVLISEEKSAIANFSTNQHIIVFTPGGRAKYLVGKNSIASSISNAIGIIRELGDKARDWSTDNAFVFTLNFITQVGGAINEGYSTVDKGFQDIINKAEENWRKQTSLYGRYKALGKRCKNPLKKALYQAKALNAQVSAGKLLVVYKGTKVVLGSALKAIPIANWLFIIGDSYKKVTDLYDIFKYLDKVKTCKEEQKYLIDNYRNNVRWLTTEVVSYEVGVISLNVVGDLTIAANLAAAIPTSGTSLAPAVISFLLKTAMNIGAELYNSFCLEPKINNLKAEIFALKFECPKDPNDDPNDDNPTQPNPNSGKKQGSYVSNTPDAQVHIDPAGFVYEAVPVNRVEGVQASIYYKETKEDMYGDPYEEIILWDAEEYAQQNPLFTDENGMYRWDVPQGLWQVKFEKDGYVTAYSEWLPVPPPQLEVNIGIVQNKQPEVTEARAYEEGVEVQFDKFMDLSTLTTSNIFVTANGEKLNGEIRLIDSALADEYASEDDADAVRYASRVRFIPEEKLSATTGEIRVTVSRNVLSYAGIPMTETFSQVLDVEKEVQMIVAEDVKVLYGGEKEVTVYALPYEAAVGRKLHIANSSDLIASIDITEATLDEEGKAIVKVKGDLPGRAQLSFTIDDVTATGECAVDVVTEIITAEAPKSSRASGTAVYRGTKIVLTTESKDATIYFTTDGSCPCDENGTRRKYTVPIIINDDTKILAMTSVGNGDDDVSETVEFNYTLKRSDMDFQMSEGWTWISHNFESAIAPTDLLANEGVSRILSQTQEVIRDPQLGVVGTLTELSASESYKVETNTATSRQRLSDFAWNPATPIALNSGWNWLGYPVDQTMSVAEAFATTAAETLDIVVGQNGFAQFDGEKWVGTLETMSPGMGYMYQSQSAKNVVYNTSIVSTASAKFAPGISTNSALVLDIHKYGVIMPVVATLTNTDGSQLDNEDYQVAAFCGSECRGVGRVVNGLVMMNVYGNVNDAITFHVTDANGETSFISDASLNFSEKVVGDIFNPYAITINNQSGIAGVKYDGNIKVSVDGDMLRIKGIAAENIDLVEVYDINGQKLIRETNVSESGIKISTLTSGVYVVIVNGNGEYTYHKIAIR